MSRASIVARPNGHPTVQNRTGVRLLLEPVDRRHELENLRRSLAMLRPGQHALDREAAMRLVAELASLTERLERLRASLRALAEED